MWFIWALSAYTNSTDFFTLPLWSVGSVFDVFKKEGIFYGPMFYGQYIDKAKTGYTWVQTWRIFNAYDDWEHLEFENFYTIYLERFKFIRTYLRMINKAINRDFGFNIYETTSEILSFSSYLRIFLIEIVFDMIINPLGKVNWKLTSNPFNYMYLTIPSSYREPLQIFFSSLLGDSQFDLIFKNYSLIFSKNMSFFTYNYYLFNLTFMQTSLLHYKFFMTNFYSVIPLFGYYYSYLYMYNFGFSIDKVARYKYLYSVATLNSLKLDLWGEYKPTASNFFMFYSRNWIQREDSSTAVPFYNIQVFNENRNSRIPLTFMDTKLYGKYKTLKTGYYKLDILKLMEERLYNSVEWDYFGSQPIIAERPQVLIKFLDGNRAYGKRTNHNYIRNFTVNQFFTPPYNIEIDWQETNNRMLDDTNPNFDVNEPILYPYNMLVNATSDDRNYTRNLGQFDISPQGLAIHAGNIKEMPLNIEFLQYLVPDLGFYGSTYWGTNFNYFLLDRETANEQLLHNSKSGPGVSRSKHSPKNFNR